MIQTNRFCSGMVHAPSTRNPWASRSGATPSFHSRTNSSRVPSAIRYIRSCDVSMPLPPQCLPEHRGVDVVLEALATVDLDDRDTQAVGALQVVVAVDEDLVELERRARGVGFDDRPGLVAQAAGSPRVHHHALHGGGHASGNVPPWPPDRENEAVRTEED